MFVTMRNEKWQRASLRIPVSPGSKQQYVFTVNGGPNGDGVYEVPDDLGFQLCYGDGYKVKTVADPSRGVVYRESMFIEGAHPSKKNKSAAQLAAELEVLQKQVELIASQANIQRIPRDVDEEEFEVIEEAMLTAGLKEEQFPIDENDPSGRYQRVQNGIIHDTQTGSYICPICKYTKTTEATNDPMKALSMHYRMKHRNQMEDG